MGKLKEEEEEEEEKEEQEEGGGRKDVMECPHPALAPALSLMSLVLGLNLLADGLREESLKD